MPTHNALNADDVPRRSNKKSKKASPELNGDCINFREIIYAPLNEVGTLAVLAAALPELHMRLVKIGTAFPDLRVDVRNGSAWERKSVELEYRSRGFKEHLEDMKQKHCDFVICWEHDWQDCPVKVVELRRVIDDITNGRKVQLDLVTPKYCVFHITAEVKGAIKELKSQLRQMRVHLQKTRLGYSAYSPDDDNFLVVRVRNKSLRFTIYTDGLEFPDVERENSSQNRGVIKDIRCVEDVKRLSWLLRKSMDLIHNARQEGRNTGYYARGIT